MNHPDLQHSTFFGEEIRGVLQELGHLRLTVFREFPYLYDGKIEDEIKYLQTYISSKRGLLYAIFHDGEMVGATTCLPLMDETEEVLRPFKDQGLDVERIFYFGESILLPNYRGLGLGNTFFDAREAHARSFGEYQFTCFCAVHRAETHSMRPANYLPLDPFWIKRGYTKFPNLTTTFGWKDTNVPHDSPKLMTFWMRPL